MRRFLLRGAKSGLTTTRRSRMSIDYRGIHLLLVLPGVLLLWREAPGEAVRRMAATMVWMIVWAMWSGVLYLHLYKITGALGVPDPARLVINGIAAALRELAWWWLVSALMALLLCLFAASPAGNDFYRRWGMRWLTQHRETRGQDPR